MQRASTLFFLSFALIVSAAYGQTFRGAINGTVTDPTGSVVAGAKVTATDVATNIAHSMAATSDGEFSFLFPKTKKFIETLATPDKLPPWLTEADLDFFAGEFKRAGFRGGVNWYRNADRNWELTPFLDGAKLRQPAVFAAGEHDVVGKMIPGGYDLAGAFTPNLKKKVIIPGVGHWVQQERPKEINETLIAFLKSL